jgi:hypothetical protein
MPRVSKESDRVAAANQCGPHASRFMSGCTRTRQFIELAPSGLVKRLVVLTPEHADLSREFSSSFLLRDLVDPGEASGQLLVDGVVWRFESAQSQFCCQIVHR